MVESDLAGTDSVGIGSSSSYATVADFSAGGIAALAEGSIAGEALGFVGEDLDDFVVSGLALTGAGD